MLATRVLRAQHRAPLIKFIGKRTPPTKIDHTPKVHPASPSTSLPNSFADYRSQAQQHGPLKNQQVSSSTPSQGSGGLGFSPPPVSSRSGASLGDWHAQQGQFFDRSELPARFRRTSLTPQEMEAIESGGASLFG